MTVALPTWPIERATAAMQALASQSGYAPRHLEQTSDSAMPPGDSSFDSWFERVASAHGLELESISIPYPQLDSVARAAPIVLRVAHEVGNDSLLVILRARRGKLDVIAPDGTTRRIATTFLAQSLRELVDTGVADEVTNVLKEVPASPTQRHKMRRALLYERLKLREGAVGWLLRPPPSEPLRKQWQSESLTRRFLLMLAAHVGLYGLTVAGWAILGRAAFAGNFDIGMALAWFLVIVTGIPLAVMASWQAAMLSAEAGALLKRVALAGACELDTEVNRQQGAGQLLGQVLEMQAIETLGAGGAFVGVAAAFELMLSMGVLALGAGGATHVLALAAWVLLTLVFCWRFFHARRTWTLARLQLTHDLVERMVGQRTRLVQEDPTKWHGAEDLGLEKYLCASVPADRLGALIGAVIPRGWLVLGVATLAPAFVALADITQLGIALGGVLLAYRGLLLLTASLPRLVDGAVAWRVARPILSALATAEPIPPVVAPLGSDRKKGDLVVDLRSVCFRYARRSRAIVDRCDWELRSGERWLLVGASGSGKSTLGSLVAGLRQPSSGLLLLDGLDRGTLGKDGWRRRVAAAPQFHENHVLSGTLAFNLLMGRRWPPTAEDEELARAVCLDLGLGPLLDRMPSGMDQMLGETGWRMSQGERARLFIARALLQDAELLVLDESLAALDPETVEQCLNTVMQRSRTLVLIAHS